MENIRGAISFATRIQSEIEQEVAHTATAISQIERMTGELNQVSTYLEGLAAFKAKHGIGGTSSLAASNHAAQIAYSVSLCKENIRAAMIDFHRCGGEMINLIEEMHRIAEQP